PCAVVGEVLCALAVEPYHNVLGLSAIPTRRSSDLQGRADEVTDDNDVPGLAPACVVVVEVLGALDVEPNDSGLAGFAIIKQDLVLGVGNGVTCSDDVTGFALACVVVVEVVSAGGVE